MLSFFDHFLPLTSPRDAIRRVMQATAERGSFDAKDLPSAATEAEIRAAVDAATNQVRAITIRHPGKREEFLMGIAMDALRGRVSGRMVAGLVGFGKAGQQ